MIRLEIVAGPPRVVRIFNCLACGAECAGEPPLSMQLGGGDALHYDLCLACALTHRTPERLRAALHKRLPEITREINRLNQIAEEPPGGSA